jgi:hypothetical protein
MQNDIWQTKFMINSSKGLLVERALPNIRLELMDQSQPGNRAADYLEEIALTGQGCRLPIYFTSSSRIVKPEEVSSFMYFQHSMTTASSRFASLTYSS